MFLKLAYFPSLLGQIFVLRTSNFHGGTVSANSSLTETLLVTVQIVGEGQTTESMFKAKSYCKHTVSQT